MPAKSKKESTASDCTGTSQEVSKPDTDGFSETTPAMTPKDVYGVVEGYPSMSLDQGWNIYKFITQRSLPRVLELGFNWGVSSCYIAAALAKLGGGQLLSIDLESRAAFEPGAEGFLKALGLRQYATLFYERETYNWRLRAFLHMDPRPEFDLVYLDGAHLFEPDALAFLLAERMLAPGGYMIFDDLNWTLERSEFHSAQPEVRALPEDIRATPHVREVFELLAKPHPNIALTWENSGWGFAQKRKMHELDTEMQVLARLRQDAAQSHKRAQSKRPRRITKP